MQLGSHTVTRQVRRIAYVLEQFGVELDAEHIPHCIVAVPSQVGAQKGLQDGPTLSVVLGGSVPAQHVRGGRNDCLVRAYKSIDSIVADGTTAIVGNESMTKRPNTNASQCETDQVRISRTYIINIFAYIGQ
jgi:hypothetical protein